MTIREKMIDVEGLPVHYFESGEGNERTLLLLAGGVGDARADWSSVIEPLADEYHVLGVDLPGFSGSAMLPETSMDAILHWMRAFMDASDLTHAVIVGHCISSIFARLFASAAPEYVSALILTNGGTFPGIPSFAQKLMRLPLIGNVLFKLFGRMICGRKTLDHLIYVKEGMSADLIQSWHSGAPVFGRMVRALLLYPRPQEQTPLVPTLLLWGTNDSMMTMAHAERLKREIPGAQLVPILDCGHLPSVEASDVFVFQVKAFLDQLSRPKIPALHSVGTLPPIDEL